MTWFLIAIGAPILWAFVNVADKYLVEKYSTGHHDSGGLIIFSSLIGILIAGVIAIFVNNIFGISISDKLLLVLSGFLTIIWFILYLYALEIEEISAVVPWFVIVPVFGYIFGYLFLGETLTTHQFIGSGIVLLGVFILSIDFMGEKRKIKIKPALYMLFASIMIAISGVIFKYVTVGGDFWVSSFWEYLGMGTMGILIFLFVPKIRKEFIHMNKKGGVKIFTLNMASEFTSTIASLMTNFALLLAPVTMVYLVSSFQPAILLFLTILGTKFFPKIITENMHHKVLIPKTIAIIIIIIGSIFLFV